MPKEDKNNTSVYTPKNHASGVGKNTIVIDKDIYGDLNSENPIPNGDSFYGVDFRIWGSEYTSRDRFRIEYGNYWDLIVPGETPGVPFDPSNPDSPGKLIYGFPIGLWTRFWYAHRLKYNSISDISDIGINTAKGIKMAQTLQSDLPIDIQQLGEVPDSKALAYPESFNLAKQTNSKLYSVSVDLQVGSTRFDEIYSAIDEWRGYVYGTNDHPGIIQESTLDNKQIFESNSFLMQAPFSNLELEKMNSGPGAIMADIKTYYSPNFAFDDYIDTIASPDIHEYTLPNLYSFLLLSEKEEEVSTFTKKMEHIESNITLANELQIAVNHRGEKLFPEMNLRDALGTMDRERYYNIYSYVLSKVIADLDNPDKASKTLIEKSSVYENIVFTESTADMMREFSEFKSSFPMSTNIAFRTDRDVELTNLLNESYLMPAIIEKVIEVTDSDMPATKNKNTMYGIKLKQFVEYSDSYTIEENPTQDSQLVKSQKFNETIRNTWDIGKIVNGYNALGDDYINENAEDHSVFFSTEELDFSDPSSSIVKVILLSAFKSRMADYISTRARSYEQIMNGEHADAEIVLYRIEKNKLNQTTGNYEPVQNIYVPNSNKIDIANIIDTQIKYGVVYQYRVYAYHAVVGAEYSYWDVWAGGANLPIISSPTDTIEIPTITPELCFDDSSLVLTGYSPSGEAVYGQLGSLSGICDPPAAPNEDIEDVITGPTVGMTNPLIMGAMPGMGLSPVIAGGYSSAGTGLLTGPGTGPDGTLGTGVMPQENLELPEHPLEDDKEAPYPDAVLSLRFNVMVRPTLKLVEMPYFNIDPSGLSMVLDMPPLPPQVNPIPFRATKDKIMFFFDGSVGKETVMPIVIDDGDLDYYNIQRLAQSVGDEEPITFNSDNPLVAFQIFRTTTPPTAYRDFKGKRITTTSKAQHTDNIKPNQKYYYTFRSIDSRGNISNPSAVYEIELVTLEDGHLSRKVATLPKIKLYNFPEPKKDNFSRSMRKYILIKPTTEQSTINEQDSKLPGSDQNPGMNLDLVEPVFGTSEKSIFSEQDLSGSAMSKRRFKLRITSKSTGRRMDFNFEFKHKHKKPSLSY